MQDRISPDYRDFAKAARSDLERAGRGRERREVEIRKMKAPDGDNAPLIPEDAMLGFSPVAPEDLRPGVFLLVRRGEGLTVRRLIGRTSEGLQVATYGGRVEDPVKPSHLLGLVVHVQSGERVFDPSRETGLAGLMSRLTQFNTRSPLAGLGRLLGAR